MPPCESKLVSRSSRKATVAKTLFVEWAQVSQLYARPRGCMPGLVGDRGQVLRVLGWALTRGCSLLFVLRSSIQGAEQWLCVEQSRELFNDIRD